MKNNDEKLWVEICFIGGIKKKLYGENANSFLTLFYARNDFQDPKVAPFLRFPKTIYPHEEHYEKNEDENFTFIMINLDNILWIEYP